MKAKETKQSSLPWKHTKLEEEDPKALALIQTIKSSPSQVGSQR